MKYTFFLASLVLSQLCFGQKVELSSTLAPEDLGAHKWIFSGTAQENQVVIFRVTTIREWPDGKVTTDIYDDVNYAPGEKQTGSAFFINPDYFKPTDEDPKWHWRALGGTGWIEGKYNGHTYGDQKGEINFKSERWGKTKKIFETFIKSYKEAALLYEGLPAIPDNGGWGWAGSPKDNS